MNISLRLELRGRHRWWQVRQRDSVHGFPVVSWNHLNRVPWAAVEESTIRSFADALLTTNTEVGIDLDSSEGRVIFVRHPEHSRLDRAVLDAGRGTRAARTAISGDCQDARPFLARRFAIADRHGPMLLDHVEYIEFFEGGCHLA